MGIRLRRVESSTKLLRPVRRLVTRVSFGRAYERSELLNILADRQELLHGRCKAKLSCEINAAGATFTGMETAVRLAA
jgi:hypothetical protein